LSFPSLKMRFGGQFNNYPQIRPQGQMVTQVSSTSLAGLL
jgi:hypothetical protein